jgi:hypothetical protein
MSNRTLSLLIVVLAFALAAGLILPNQSISSFMESCGDSIAKALGY